MFVTFFALFALAVVGTKAEESGVTKPQCTRSTSGPQCASDCSTLMMCLANKGDPLATATCSSPNQYCVNGACTSSPSATCTGGSSTFTCTSDGIFPDPSVCTKYHVCSEGKPTSQSIDCETGFVFNSKLNVCQKGTAPCSKIDCTRATQARPYIAYASNTNYYAYCLISGSTIQTFMCKCNGDELFDTTTNECRFYCKASGYFKKRGSCNEFFYCSVAGAKAESLSCPASYVFDGTGCNSDTTKCQS